MDGVFIQEILLKQIMANIIRLINNYWDNDNDNPKDDKATFGLSVLIF
jgi:hypothetical protein